MTVVPHVSWIVISSDLGTNLGDDVVRSLRQRDVVVGLLASGCTHDQLERVVGRFARILDLNRDPVTVGAGGQRSDGERNSIPVDRGELADRRRQLAGLVVVGTGADAHDVGDAATVEEIGVHGVGEVRTSTNPPKVFTNWVQLVTSTGSLNGPEAANPTNAATAVPTPSIGLDPEDTSSM